MGISASKTHMPKVSLIITVHNEADRIREKIENSLAIDYPGMGILIASDCSIDATDSIVGEYQECEVKLIRALERKGKEFAQLCAIRACEGMIIVFSDAGTHIKSESIKKVVSHFADSTIGAISSEDRFLQDDGELVWEGAYVEYEMLLRRMESDVGGLIGLSGS